MRLVNIVWRAPSCPNINKIQSGQIRAARLIKNESVRRSHVKTHRQELLDQLNWPNAKQIIFTSTVNLVKKAITGKSAKGMNKLFKINYSQQTRKGPNIRLEHCGKIAKKGDTFSVKGSEMFNNLPMQLKNPSLTEKQFKIKLKLYPRTKNLPPAH